MPARKSTATSPARGSGSLAARFMAFGWLLRDHHSYWRASSSAPISRRRRTTRSMKKRFVRYSGEPPPDFGVPRPPAAPGVEIVVDLEPPHPAVHPLAELAVAAEPGSRSVAWISTTAFSDAELDLARPGG